MLLFYLPGFQSSDYQEFRKPWYPCMERERIDYKGSSGEDEEVGGKCLQGRAFCSFEAGDQVTKEIVLQFNTKGYKENTTAFMHWAGRSNSAC